MYSLSVNRCHFYDYSSTEHNFQLFTIKAKECFAVSCPWDVLLSKIMELHWRSVVGFVLVRELVIPIKMICQISSQFSWRISQIQYRMCNWIVGRVILLLFASISIIPPFLISKLYRYIRLIAMYDVKSTNAFHQARWSVIDKSHANISIISARPRQY